MYLKREGSGRFGGVSLQTVGIKFTKNLISMFLSHIALTSSPSRFPRAHSITYAVSHSLANTIPVCEHLGGTITGNLAEQNYKVNIGQVNVCDAVKAGPLGH